MSKKIFVLVAALVVLVVAAVALTGCNMGTTQGTGPMVTHEISADGFTGINITGAYNLTFTQASYFSVTLEIQENLIQHLDTNVRGGVLHVGFSRGISTTGGNTPRLYISAPYLDSLLVEGAASADMTLDVDTLDVEIEGAGNVTLTGTANTLNVVIEGAGNIRAFDMVARDVVINLEGAGNADVHATDTLNASISGVGRIRYDGSPTVTRNISGLGTVTGRN